MARKKSASASARLVRKDRKLVRVMAIDPGVKTGVCRGVFDLSHGTVSAVMMDAFYREDGKRLGSGELGDGSSVVCDEVEGSEYEQAALLMELWEELCDSGYGPTHGHPAYLVCENWTPRLPLKSGKREVFYPVRIPACLEGHLKGLGDDHYAPPISDGQFGVDGPDGSCMRYQMPSSAMAFATNERLKRWGCWVIGSDHKRDAVRHVALLIDSLLG